MAISWVTQGVAKPIPSKPFKLLKSPFFFSTSKSAKLFAYTPQTSQGAFPPSTFLRASLARQKLWRPLGAQPTLHSSQPAFSLPCTFPASQPTSPPEIRPRAARLQFSAPRPPQRAPTGLLACSNAIHLGSLQNRVALASVFAPMSSSSRWGDSRGLASTLLSLVRPQSSPTRDDPPASSEAPRSSAKKHKHRKRRDREHQQQDQDDDAMTSASQELPPLRNDHEASEGEADFGALEVFDSNAAASSQAVEPASSKKSRRDKKKDSSATKAQKRANRHSSSANGHDYEEPAVTPSSPSKKKRKNSDSSDGKERKKRKSHAAIDSIPEEQTEPALPSSPSAARAQKRGPSGDGADLNGADVDEIERDVEAVAREAWQEHISKQASQLQDTEMTDTAPVAAMAPVEIPVEAQEEAPADDATTTPRRARSTRKKSKPTYFDQPVTDASLDAFGQLPSPSAVTPKPRRAKKAASKKGPRRQRKADREQDLYGGEAPRGNYTQGKFSDEELSRVAHAIESFRAEYDMEQRDVNDV